MNFPQIKSAIKADLEKEAGRFLEAAAKANVDLSRDRLQGKYGATYSHRYFNIELGALVARYRIKHDQTGRLAKSTKWVKTGKFTAKIYNDARGRTTQSHVDILSSRWNPRLDRGMESSSMAYAGKIAELDEREVGMDAWEWAGRRVMGNAERGGADYYMMLYR